MNGNENKIKGIAGRVASLVKNAVEECGCRLWDVEFVKEGSDHNLIIYIDKEGGVSLTDCQMVNDAVDPIIEADDPIAGSYYLEISSAGIERELKTTEHIEAYIGTEVNIKLYAPKDGKKNVLGILESFDKENAVICIVSEAGEKTLLTRKECAKIQTVCDF